jgi:hypothetical protein
MRRRSMATIVKTIPVQASSEAAWDAIRDVGSLHTRLVPGFVVDTKLEDGVRIVTFANGQTINEPIVSIDDTSRRLVWTAQGGRTTHYNASLSVDMQDGVTTIRWIADFLPDATANAIDRAMEAGALVMQATLGSPAQRLVDRLQSRST